MRSGAFVVAGLLMVVAGLIKPLEKAIEKIPAPVAAAMLAGVLLRYTLGVPGAAMAMPWAVLPLVVVFFGLRLSYPLYAVPVVVVAGRGDCRRSAAASRAIAAASASPRWNGRRPPSTGRPSCRSACRCSSSPWPRRTCRASRCCGPAATSRRCSPHCSSPASASIAAGALRQPCHQHGGDHGLDRDRPRLPSGPEKALARGLALSRALRR